LRYLQTHTKSSHRVCLALCQHNIYGVGAAVEPNNKNGSNGWQDLIESAALVFDLHLFSFTSKNVLFER